MGGFDPIYPHYGEDNDYVNRLHFWGKKIGVDCSIIAYHDRIHDIDKKATFNSNRIEISYLSTLNNINFSLRVQKNILITVAVRKILKSLLKFNIDNIKIYVQSYRRTMRLIPSIKQCRSNTTTKKAYLQ